MFQTLFCLKYSVLIYDFSTIVEKMFVQPKCDESVYRCCWDNVTVAIGPQKLCPRKNVPFFVDYKNALVNDSKITKLFVLIIAILAY